MRISPQVAALEIRGANNSIIYPLLIWDDEKNLALIDAGFPGQLELFREAISSEGFALSDITHILLTHQDLDHIGNLRQLLAEAPAAKVYAHRNEAPCIRGDEPPSKTVALAAQREQTPENAARLQEQISNYLNFTARVDVELLDGEVIPICGGIQVIHTPGHTPGHICFFLQRDKVLATGDTVSVSEGALTGANPVHTPDMALAAKSNQMLADYDAEVLVGYHGGAFKGDVSKAIRELPLE